MEDGDGGGEIHTGRDVRCEELGGDEGLASGLGGGM